MEIIVGKYILDGKIPVLADDIENWAEGFEQNRRVEQTKIGEVAVSTVFLGLDHSFDSGPPLLFETMVFGGPLDGEQERCSTWKEAEVMHYTMCGRVRDNPVNE